MLYINVSYNYSVYLGYLSFKLIKHTVFFMSTREI